jgi:FkbM family methyltransferase
MKLEITKKTKLLLNYFGLYYAFRYSKIYFKILKLKNPGYIQALNDDLFFYQSALENSPKIIFDVGANHGDKAWCFCQIAEKVICFEPDNTCYVALSARYRHDDSVFLENVALGSSVGTEVFFVEEEGSAYNTLNTKERDWIISERKRNITEVSVTVSTLDSMIKKYGAPDFIKIDVEGGELSVLNGLSSQIPVICFEANLPRFLDETVSIIERFSYDKNNLFNIRLGDEFLFTTKRSADEIMRILSKNEEISYDIFIYNHALLHE